MLISRYLLLLTVVTYTSKLNGQQFARTADRNNFTSGQKINDQVVIKWKFQTNDRIFSSPVISENVVIIGSLDSTLYALDAENGRVVWKFKTNGAIRSTASVSNNRVFILSTDGHCYAIDKNSGKKIWAFKTGGEQFYDTWDYFQSSPVCNGDVVYFGSGDTHIYALDAATGKLIWKYKTGGIVHASPTIADDAILIGSFDGNFYCMNTDGSLRWKFKTIGEHYFPKGEIQFNAALSDSTVYFGARDYNLYALKIKDGSGHWVYHHPGSWTGTPSITREQLILTMSDSHSILLFDKTYGNKRFESQVPINVFSSAAINDSLAYFGALDGKMYRLNIKNGKTEAIFQTESSRKFGSDFFDVSGNLRKDLPERYENDFNRLYNDFLKMGSILSTAWIDNGVLFFGSADGAVYALE